MKLPPLSANIAVLSVLLLLMVMFIIPDTEARPRHGKSFHRGGHASTGSFRPGGNVRRGVRQDRRQDRRRRIAVGDILAVGEYDSLGCPQEIKTYEGINYFRCEGAWYKQIYVGGQIAYTAVVIIPGY